MKIDEPLSEDAIAALLKANDGTADFGAERRDRLRQRIPELRGIDSAVNDDQGFRIDNEPDDISIVAASEPSGARRRRLLPIAAALALVVAVFSVALLRPDNAPQDQLEMNDDESVVSPTIVPVEPAIATAEPFGVGFCRDLYGPLLDAVDAWGGVDTWIFLLDRRLPEPDLASLSQQAIAAAVLIADTPNLEDLTMRLGELRDGVEPAPTEGAPQAWSSEEIEAHRTAVTDSLAALDRLVSEQGWTVHPGCDR